MQLATPLGVIAGGALLAALSVGPVLAAAAMCCAAVTLAQLLPPAFARPMTRIPGRGMTEYGC